MGRREQERAQVQDQILESKPEQLRHKEAGSDEVRFDLLRRLIWYGVWSRGMGGLKFAHHDPGGEECRGEGVVGRSQRKGIAMARVDEKPGGVGGDGIG